MKLINVTKLGGSILGLLLLLGIGVMSSTTAQAQYPYPNQDQYRRDRDRNNDRYRDRNNDRYRDRDYDPYRDRDYDRYRNGDYDRDQDRYGRRGRNWDGYGNYGGTYELRQTALNAGYNEGVKAGRDDRRHNRGYDFRDNSAYQRATKDYNSRMGDRWMYQRYFRDAFENGYADGFRGY